MSALATVEGKCEQLVIGGEDLTSICKGVILNTAYKSGRTGFLFVATNKAIVTFSGVDSPAVGDEASSRLDGIILSRLSQDKPNPVGIPARGACLYGNPYRGPARITCTAETDQGPFRASFLSDGKPPRVDKF